MIRRANILLVLSVVALTLGGCKSEPPPPTEADEPASESAVAAEPEAEGTPKIAVDEPVFDFGAIKPTDKAEHVFKIKNAGTADLKIIKVQKTCGCTATVLAEDVVPPGGETEVKVTLTPKGGPEISKRIIVETNDPEQPQFTLTMQGKLVFDLTASPTMVAIRDLDLNTPGTGTFKLELSEGTTAKVVSVEVVEADKAKFSVKKIEGEADGNATYEVRYAGRDTIGQDSTRVVVKTTGENTPELFVAVQAGASLNLRYADKMRFSYREGALQERVVRISARKGDAPEIKKIEDPDGLLDSEVLAPQGAMASVKLVVREDKLNALAPEARSGMHTLILHTSDKQEPKIEIQYSIALEPKQKPEPKPEPKPAP